MKRTIQKLFEDLKSLIEHDTYALSNNDISEISWKIDRLKDEIFEIYKDKRLD